MDGGYRSRSRAGSFSGGYGGTPYRSPSPYGGVPFPGGGVPFPGGGGIPGGGGSTAYGDPYAYDEPHTHRRSRSHSRSRHHSSSSPIIIAPPAYGSSPMAIPGSTYGSYGGAYGGGVNPYGQTLGTSPAYTGSSMPSYGYAGSPTVLPAPAGNLIVPSSHRRRHHSSSSHHHHRPRSSDGRGYVRY
jgi:hypothetical protein